MAIEITIIASPENVNLTSSSYSFSDQGGTLGRSKDNLWVLEDPHKYMSSVHAQISWLAEQYFLTDLSTNGTFVNSGSEPIGKGNKVVLNNGDTFTISDYDFVVKVDSQSNNDDSFPINNSSDPFSAVNSPAQNSENFPVTNSFNNDPFASGFSESVANRAISALNEPQQDPLALLDKVSSSDPFAENIALDPAHHKPLNSSAAIENACVVNDAIDWPVANKESVLIPDDWDDWQENEAIISAIPQPGKPSRPVEAANFSQPPNEASDYAELEQTNKILRAEISDLKRQLAEAKNVEFQHVQQHQDSKSSDILIDAMGLNRWNLTEQKTVQLHKTVGLLMREMMQGMMRVLKFRKKIKEEFRINVTTIQSIENNPLKFSANIDDAMENMFIKENNAYKAPVDAVREGFQGIAEHQVAVIAGMQAAFRGMIERFDPDNLESRFEKYKSSSLLSLGQKSRRWNAYKEYHQGLIDNLDDSFQHLFGYDFVQAYEDQMQSLISARITAKDNDETNH